MTARVLVLSGAAAAVTAAAIAGAAVVVAAREAALDRVAGPATHDDTACQCPVCTFLRRSALTTISPDGEW